MSDLLNELTDGEDNFDVDLMAAGCRVRVVAEPESTLSAQQLLALYKFDRDDVERLLVRLVEDEVLSTSDLFRAAEQIASGRSA